MTHHPYLDLREASDPTTESSGDSGSLPGPASGEGQHHHRVYTGPIDPSDRARWRYHLATGPFRGPFESKMAEAIIALDDEVTRLSALIESPQTEDFFQAVRLEAAHQVERWGTEHDAGKEPADWFWLIGYLAGKALHDVRGKRAHHIIATAAALLNWHRAVTGASTAMRPGIEPPEAA